MPFVAGGRPAVAEAANQLIAHTWEPTLSVTGAAGLPAIADAGNVLRPSTSLQLSFRLPPTCESAAAMIAVERALTAEPPYGAHVTVGGQQAATGWNAPPFAGWLDSALDKLRPSISVIRPGPSARAAPSR